MTTTDSVSAQPKARMTSKELAQQVAEAAGVDPDLLCMSYFFVDARDAVWEVNKPSPLPNSKDSLIIFSIFRGAGGFAHIYAVPVKEGAPYTRFVVSSVSKSLFGESMGLEVFRGLVTEELRALDKQVNAADVEREDILAYLKTLPGDYPVAEIVSDIEELVHHETIEEDDPDPVEPEQASPTAGVEAPASTAS